MLCVLPCAPWVSPRPVLACLSAPELVKALSALLLERKVILVSRQQELLGCCCEALLGLLYPFTWSHTYIPLLCRQLLPYINAPFPYLIGLPHRFFDEAQECVAGGGGGGWCAEAAPSLPRFDPPAAVCRYIDGGDVVIVDLDAGVVTLPEAPSTPLLPFESGELAELVQVLRRTLHPRLRTLAMLDLPVEDAGEPRGGVRVQVPHVGELSVTTTHAEAAVAAAQEGHGLLRSLSAAADADTFSDSASDGSEEDGGDGDGEGEGGGKNGGSHAGGGASGGADDGSGGGVFGDSALGDGPAPSPTASQASASSRGLPADSVAVPVPCDARDECAALRMFVLRPLLRLMCK